MAERLQADVVGAGVEVGLDRLGDRLRRAVRDHRVDQPVAPTVSARGLTTGLRLVLRRRRRIVTEITAATTFWPAEDYHQRYLEKRGQATCAVALRDDAVGSSG